MYRCGQGLVLSKFWLISQYQIQYKSIPLFQDKHTHARTTQAFLCSIERLEESVQLLEMSSGPLANTDRQVTDAVDVLTLRCLPFPLLIIRPVGEPPVEPVQQMALINSQLTTREIPHNKWTNVICYVVTNIRYIYIYIYICYFYYYFYLLTYLLPYLLTCLLT